MQHAQKKILEDLVAEARAEMQHGAVRDHAKAITLGGKIVKAASWESMDNAEMNCFAQAVIEYACWLTPSSHDQGDYIAVTCIMMGDYMVSSMTRRCVESNSTRSK